MVELLVWWWKEPAACHIEYPRHCAALSSEVTLLKTNIHNDMLMGKATAMACYFIKIRVRFS